MKVAMIIIVIGALGTINKKIDNATGGLGNKWTSGDHTDYSINIGQNIDKSFQD